jgi:hypothetical protein
MVELAVRLTRQHMADHALHGPAQRLRQGI